MNKPTDIGMNRTGIATSPIDSAALMDASRRTQPPPGTEAEIASIRKEYSTGAEPVGKVPPPATLKGAAKAAVKMITGEKPSVFIDKLGERLAFERTGSRLYEALLAKYDAQGSYDGGPDGPTLMRIHNEEVAHLELLRRALEQLGADPTAMTPSADVTAVESTGLMQVLTDPRTTVPQCLHALLIAELADNEAWAMLSALATELGHEELAEQFDLALQQEQDHLAHVRSWVTEAARREANLEFHARAP